MNDAVAVAAATIATATESISVHAIFIDVFVRSKKRNTIT